MWSARHVRHGGHVASAIRKARIYAQHVCLSNLILMSTDPLVTGESAPVVDG
jgi:hypothetical protein